MEIQVEHECPQCGAPIQFEETDRLLRCPYCDVQNFLFVRDYFRYVLPHKAPGREIIYAPYLRFKGSVYYCQGMNINYRVVDITDTGLLFKGIPDSLGLRPQAMKMKFVEPDTEGSFLRLTLQAKDIIARAGRFSEESSCGTLYHRAYIGETLSIIYLPLYEEKGRLFDAVLNRPIANLSKGGDTIGSAVNKNPRWMLSFIPTLCPVCGWNLKGERDSVILTCDNCYTAWEAHGGKFEQVRFFLVPAQGKNSIYLPFWKISAGIKGIEINSFADFIRFTNQPKAIKKEWETMGMSFWSPAFKIRPKIFLNLSKRLTITREQFHTEKTIKGKCLYPVTLPQAEAVQGMKLTLAGSTLNKKTILPLMPRIGFEIKKTTLVYLPFQETGQEMIQEHTKITINKNSLAFGRKL